MIVAGALASFYRYLLSEDLQENLKLNGLTILNPFKVKPASHERV